MSLPEENQNVEPTGEKGLVLTYGPSPKTSHHYSIHQGVAWLVTRLSSENVAVFLWESVYFVRPFWGLLDTERVSSVPMPFIISPGMLGRPLVAKDQKIPDWG